MSQNSLVQAVHTIQDIARTSGSKEKLAKLIEGESGDLQCLLYYTYNKYITFRVKKIEQPDKYAEVQPDTLSEFVTLADSLAAHKWGTNEALDRIKKFLAMNVAEVAEVYTNVLLRDIRAGIDVKSVNKAFPGLVPTFYVMLADKVEDVDAIKYPCVCETKMDGIRTIAVYDGKESVKFFSREGRELDECGVIAAEIMKMAPGFPAVYDGELIAYKPNLQDKTCKKNIEGNWPFHFGLALIKNENKTASDVKKYLKFYIWDVIDYEYFVSTGAKGKAEPLSERKMKLTALFNRHGDTFKNIEMLPNVVINNSTELSAQFRKLRNEGQEGMMVKFLDSVYEFKRSKKLLKMKEFFSMDLRVVGAEEGSGKYAGMLGALLLEDDTGAVKTKVGSGFTDEDRAEIWVEFISGRLVGKIVEINGQEVTKDGSVRFPTYICTRMDKTTTNIEC